MRLTVGRRRLAGRFLLAGLVAGVFTITGSAPADAINRYTLPSGRSYTAWKDVPTVTTAVVVLHSFNHDDSEPVAQGWLTAAARHNFLAVFPTGNGSWNAGLCCGRARDTGRDDVAFLAAVQADVVARWHPARVFYVGWSNGAMMVERLVVERPELTRRFVLAGGAPEMPNAGTWPGRGWIYHGRRDTTVPWAGGHPAWCGCEIRPGQRTPTWIRGASLWAYVDPARGHAVPAGWPELAWSRLVS
jgi:polyhydroxybutyrate depolymerase